MTQADGPRPSGPPPASPAASRVPQSAGAWLAHRVRTVLQGVGALLSLLLYLIGQVFLGIGKALIRLSGRPSPVAPKAPAPSAPPPAPRP